MRKKVLSIILGMAMLSGVLAGCGSNGGDTVQNNTAAESEASAETVDPDTENTETESEETQYPITISHAYGETVIESKPERIVTLGWGNQDTVLALGVVPVGVSAANYGYVTEHGLHEVRATRMYSMTQMDLTTRQSAMRRRMLSLRHIQV